MGESVPLSALLSHVLTAYTIEFDNEAEKLIQHRTTRHGKTSTSRHALWLTSMVMWMNCMRYVGDEGVSVRDLERLAQTKTNLAGMERWGYVVVAPDPDDRRPKPPRSTWLVRATPSGREARRIWQQLFDTTEKRWIERFGRQKIDELRESLCAVAAQIPIDLPDCLPILGYGLFSKGQYQSRVAQAGADPDAAELGLPALLSRVLLAFAIDFEEEAAVSLAISANVLRLVGDDGVAVRDLPRLAGVSKEAVAAALSYLRSRGFAAIEAHSSNKSLKMVELTPAGRRAKNLYFALVLEIEQKWQKRFSEAKVRSLRSSLENLVGDTTDRKSPLFLALETHPEGWRASLPKAESLPHYPMVLHRGGFPDGS